MQQTSASEQYCQVHDEGLYIVEGPASLLYKHLLSLQTEATCLCQAGSCRWHDGARGRKLETGDVQTGPKTLCTPLLTNPNLVLPQAGTMCMQEEEEVETAR